MPRLWLGRCGAGCADCAAGATCGVANKELSWAVELLPHWDDDVDDARGAGVVASAAGAAAEEEDENEDEVAAAGGGGGVTTADVRSTGAPSSDEKKPGGDC